MTPENNTEKYSGYTVDGVHYATAKLAAAALGMNRFTFRDRCRSIGRREVTAKELGLDRYRRLAVNSGNEAWHRLSGSSNTGQLGASGDGYRLPVRQKHPGGARSAHRPAALPVFWL